MPLLGFMYLVFTRMPGVGLMNTVLNYASGKPFDPLHGYSYVHDSNLRHPRQIAATVHKILSVTTVLA